MNLMINASNLRVGGGIQVASSFLTELVNNSSTEGVDIFCAISDEVLRELDEITLGKLNYLVVNYNVKKLWDSSGKQQLNSIELENKIDVVFSVFGPTYWTPQKAKHLVGFALPWLIYDTRKVMERLTLYNKAVARLSVIIHKFFLKNHSCFFVTETEDAAERLSNKLAIDKKKISVVGNTASNFFFLENERLLKLESLREENIKYICTVTYPHVHKNMEIIPLMMPYLNKDIKFIVTLPDDFFNEVFQSCRDRVINLGRVENRLCREIYDFSDAVFSPSLLECFSANYVEAFQAGKPLFVSNLPFATGICKDAGIYFDPYDPIDAADKINSSLSNDLLVKEKIKIGKGLSLLFPSSKVRSSMYLDLSKKLHTRD
jgi:hypothetical protein